MEIRKNNGDTLRKVPPFSGVEMRNNTVRPVSRNRNANHNTILQSVEYDDNG